MGSQSSLEFSGAPETSVMFDLTVETPSYPEDSQLWAASVFLHLYLPGRLKGK